MDGTTLGTVILGVFVTEIFIICCFYGLKGCLGKTRQERDEEKQIFGLEGLRKKLEERQKNGMPPRYNDIIVDPIHDFV